MTRRFEDTEERAHDDKAGKVLAGGMAAESDSPSDDAKGKILGDRHSGNDVVLGVFDNEDGKVDTGREPRELEDA